MTREVTDTRDSTVSDLYHEKRVSSSAEEEDTESPLTGPQPIPVRHAYRDGTDLCFVIDDETVERIFTVPFPITTNGTIDRKAFKPIDSNPYTDTIRFFQTLLENDPEKTTELNTITGELNEERSKISIAEIDATFPVKSSTRTEKEDREDFSEMIDVLSALAQYFGDGDRGIRTTTTNYREPIDTETKFKVDAPVTDALEPTFTFDVDGIEADPETDPTSRFIENAGSGDPTLIPGATVVLIHKADQPDLVEDDSHRIATCNDNEWVVILPDDHVAWWRNWRDENTDTPPVSTLSKYGLACGTVVAGCGGLLTVAAVGSFDMSGGGISQSLGEMIMTIGFAVAVLGAVVLAISLVGYLIMTLTDTPRQLLRNHYFDTLVIE